MARTTLVENDIQRRNTIAILLQDWNLIDIVKKEDANNKFTFKSDQSFTI